MHRARRLAETLGRAVCGATTTLERYNGVEGVKPSALTGLLPPSLPQPAGDARRHKTLGNFCSHVHSPACLRDPLRWPVFLSYSKIRRRGGAADAALLISYCVPTPLYTERLLRSFCIFRRLWQVVAAQVLSPQRGSLKSHSPHSQTLSSAVPSSRATGVPLHFVKPEGDLCIGR